MSKQKDNKESQTKSELYTVLTAGYSTEKALLISKNYKEIDDFYKKCRYIIQQHGVNLIIKNKRFWFEYYGKQITVTDFYITNSVKVMLSSACS